MRPTTTPESSARITGDMEQGFTVEFGGQTIDHFRSLQHARLCKHQ